MWSSTKSKVDDVEDHIHGHVVCLPTTAQSHMGPMLKLAKLLHHRGFRISFVNTESNHRRILQARGGSSSLDLPEGFEFVTISDGFPVDQKKKQPPLSVRVDYVKHGMEAPLLELVTHLNSKAAVSCIVADNYMTFSAGPISKRFGVPLVHLWTSAACALMGVMQFPLLQQKGFTSSSTADVSPDTLIDWIPAMKNTRLRDIPNFIRTTETDDILFKLTMDAIDRADDASATIIHSFEALEPDVLNALSAKFSRPIYAIAPFHLLLDRIHEQENLVKSVGCSLWKEDTECLQWLHSKEPKSVLYVNFGSVASLTPQQLTEFAMGISNSNQPFLWIIRPDLVSDDDASVLPREFVEETKGRGFTTGWCPQEEVLNHPSIGGFLSHCGWNSTLESLSAGIPMLCWPCFGDQLTDCRFICKEWEIGLEIESCVDRDNVERLVRELMEGEEGKRLRKRAMEWRRIAHAETSSHGSSSINFERFINEILS